MGDFNLHMNKLDFAATKMLGILEDAGFKQHVSAPTDEKRDILDLIVARVDDPVVQSADIHYPGGSDHYAVVYSLVVSKAVNATS